MAAYTEGGHTERWSKRRGFSETGRMFEFVVRVFWKGNDFQLGTSSSGHFLF